MSEIKVASKVFRTPSVTGTFTCTITDLGWTPKAVLLHSVAADVVDTVEDQYNVAYGAAVDGGQWYCLGEDKHGEATVRSWCRFGTGNVLYSGGLKGTASALENVGPTANGWIFNEVNAAPGYYMIATFFGGADLTVSLGATTISVTTTVTITTGHEPDLVFFALAGTADGLADTDSTHMSHSFGVASNNGAGYDKAMLSAGSQYNWGSARNCGIMYNDRIAAAMYANSVRYSINFDGAYGTSGFLVDSNGDPRGNVLMWLSLNTGDRSTFAGVRTMPASTGAQKFTLGFTPQFAAFELTEMSVTNSLQTSGGVNVIGRSTYDGTRLSGSHMSYSRQSVADMDTATAYHQDPIFIYDDNHANLRKQSHVMTFDTDGVSVSYTVATNVTGAVVWGIQEESAGAGPPVTVMYDFYKMMRGGS